MKVFFFLPAVAASSMPARRQSQSLVPLLIMSTSIERKSKVAHRAAQSMRVRDRRAAREEEEEEVDGLIGTDERRSCSVFRAGETRH